MDKFAITFRTLDNGKYQPRFALPGQEFCAAKFKDGSAVEMGSAFEAEAFAGHSLVHALNSNSIYAAAPDMLAALEAVVAAGSWHDDGTFVIYTETDSPDDEGAVGIAYAAIAKATGGAAPAPAVTVAECLEALRDIVASSEANDHGSLMNAIQDGSALIAKAEGRAQ